MRAGTKRRQAHTPSVETPQAEASKEAPKALDVAKAVTAAVVAEVVDGIEVEGARLHVALAANEPLLEGGKIELWFAATKNSGRTLVGRFRSELASEAVEDTEVQAAERTRIAASVTRWVNRYKD